MYDVVRTITMQITMKCTSNPELSKPGLHYATCGTVRKCTMTRQMAHNSRSIHRRRGWK